MKTKKKSKFRPEVLATKSGKNRIKTSVPPTHRTTPSKNGSPGAKTKSPTSSAASARTSTPAPSKNSTNSSPTSGASPSRKSKPTSTASAASSLIAETQTANGSSPGKRYACYEYHLDSTAPDGFLSDASTALANRTYDNVGDLFLAIGNKFIGRGSVTEFALKYRADQNRLDVG